MPALAALGRLSEEEKETRSAAASVAGEAKLESREEVEGGCNQHREKREGAKLSPQCLKIVHTYFTITGPTWPSGYLRHACLGKAQTS